MLVTEARCEKTAVHTMAELKLSGNHLKGSRPVLSFDKVRCPRCCLSASPRRAAVHDSANVTVHGPLVCSEYLVQTLVQRLPLMLLQTFEEAPHWQLLKEVFTHVFATPKRHHRSKPFFDHVIAFTVADGRVWLRNYQVQTLHRSSTSMEPMLPSMPADCTG
jgi:ribosome biogenesis protein BRX1